MSKKRNRMPGLRCKSGIWHIEKRCKHAEGGWFRESTETTSRAEAERYLIKRLADLEQQAQRQADDCYTFEEAGMQYLADIAHKSSADASAMHLDQMFPFIGSLTLEQIHDGTIKDFIDHERARGVAPKTINNAIAVISAVLNRAARVWRSANGTPWLKQAPPRLTRQVLTGQQAKPYPLSWQEQDGLLANLKGYLADAALFAVNTGCREQEICQLQWAWEVPVIELGISVFVLPETMTKTRTERIVVLNSVANDVINARRGMHPDFVFTYRNQPVKKLNSSAWRRAWKVSGLPYHPAVMKGVHNLQHTFGRRLRAAAIPLETRKVLMGHASGDITTHYSAAELSELLSAVEKITDRRIAQTPTLSLMSTLARQKGTKPFVGKVSESKKELHANTLLNQR